jgi:hypothetical protein
MIFLPVLDDESDTLKTVSRNQMAIEGARWHSALRMIFLCHQISTTEVDHEIIVCFLALAVHRSMM